MINNHLFILFAISFTLDAMDTITNTKTKTKKITREEIAAKNACAILNFSENNEVKDALLKLFTEKNNDQTKEQIINKLVR